MSFNGTKNAKKTTNYGHFYIFRSQRKIISYLTRNILFTRLRQPASTSANFRYLREFLNNLGMMFPCYAQVKS